MATKRGGSTSDSDAKRKPVRAWCDGCFDMVHFGHANFLRQASKLADELYVGIHTDEEISHNKGPPVMTLAERTTMVQAVKWVTGVIPAAPYVTNLEVMDEHNCDFCVHGDDVTLAADGEDAYRYVRQAGRYKECPRTKGVSTTNLVGRMLLMTKEHHHHSHVSSTPGAAAKTDSKSPYTGKEDFLLTSEIIQDFLAGTDPKTGDRIIYVAGAFDLFHAGHVDFLKKARELGDYLVVGLHSDQDVNKYLGKNYPIMHIYERALSVGACRYVDRVEFPAPFVVTQEWLDKIKPDKVVHGLKHRAMDEQVWDSMYELPKEQGIYVELDSGSTLTTDVIIERILKNRRDYEERNRKKEAKEVAFIEKQG